MPSSTGNQTPNGFSFVDDEKTLHIQLQYGSLISPERQDRDVPYVGIDIQRILSRMVEDGVDFADGWFLSHVMRPVLGSLDTFLESFGVDALSSEIEQYLPVENAPYDHHDILSMTSFALPERPTAQFNVRKLKRAIMRFHDDPDSTEFYLHMRLTGIIESRVREVLARPVLSTNEKCIDDLFEDGDVSAAVDEMSAAMDRELGDRTTTFSANVKQPSDTTKPTAGPRILKRSSTVGSLAHVMVSPPVDATASEKKGSLRPFADSGHVKRSGRSRADDDGRGTQSTPSSGSTPTPIAFSFVGIHAADADGRSLSCWHHIISECPSGHSPSAGRCLRLDDDGKGIYLGFDASESDFRLARQ